MSGVSWRAFFRHVTRPPLLRRLHSVPTRRSHQDQAVSQSLPRQHLTILRHPVLLLLESCETPGEFDQILAHMTTTGQAQYATAAGRLLMKASSVSPPSSAALAAGVLSQTRRPDTFCHNVVIKACSRGGEPLFGMSVFRAMLSRHCDDARPNEYTFCFLLDCCSAVGRAALREGAQVQAQLFKRVDGGVFAGTSLVHMYAKCGSLEDALQTFAEMPDRTEASWGAAIDACVNHWETRRALALFAEMRCLHVESGNAALVGALSACGALGELGLGRAVHGVVAVTGAELNLTLGTSLVDMYAKCGDVDAARRVFSSLPAKSAISWGCMVHGLAVNGRGVGAVGLFREMRRAGVTPLGSTFVSVLTACNHAGLVEEAEECFSQMTSAFCKDAGVKPGLKHYGCMVDIYGRAGRVAEAMEVVRGMLLVPDAVIWETLLAACRAHGHRVLGEAVAAQLVKVAPVDAATGCRALSEPGGKCSAAWAVAEAAKRKKAGCSSICSQARALVT